MFDLDPGNLSDLVWPSIHLGGISAIENEEHFNQLGVLAVLNMAWGCYSDNAIPNCKVYRLPIDDCALTEPGVFRQAADIIEEAVNMYGPILVHCTMGISRSTTAVLAYLMIYHRVGWEDGLALIREARPYVKPHPLLKESLVRDLGEDFLP